MRRLVAPLLFALASPASAAAVYFPADGIWEFTASSGSGLTLDFRDGTVGIGLYTYDEDGHSVWYSGAGDLVDGVLETTLGRYHIGTGGALEPVGAPRPLRMEFLATTIATLAFDGGDAIPTRHLAFGADYVGAFQNTTPGGHGGIVAPVLPDLRGRWLFTERVATGQASPPAREIEFTDTLVQDDGRTAWFRSSELPDETGQGTVRYNIVCAPPPSGFTRCELYSESASVPHTMLASFDPADLTANRIVSDSDNSESLGFRIPLQPDASPSAGIWQIRGRPGEGLTLDVRPDGVAVGVFGYSDNGEATWSLAQGEIVDGVLTAPLQSYSGSCLNCTHEAPMPTGPARTLRLEFVAPTRARLTLDNEEPLAVSLLPFGALYMEQPIGGDPRRTEFGPHFMPRMFGQWVMSSTFEQFDFAPFAVYPPVHFQMFSFGSTASGSDSVPWMRAQSRPYISPLAPDLLTQTTILKCGEHFAEYEDTPCWLQFHVGAAELSPPPPPFDVARMSPWDVSATRIVASSIEGNDIPVWAFRIPPRESEPFP